MKNIKKLLGNSSKYIIGDILSKGSIFFLAPIYTHYFSPSEYGILTFSTVIYSVLYILFSFGLSGAAFRFYFVHTDILERKLFYGTLWIFLIFSSGLFSAISLFIGKISTDLFANIPFFPFISITIGITFFRVSFELIPYQLIRASEKSSLYIKFSLITLLVTISFQFVFVVILGRGLIGIFQGNFATVIFMSILYMAFILKNIVMNFSLNKLVPALKYSIPLIPHYLANWGLNLSDRVIIERKVKLELVGIYSFAGLFRQGYFLIINGLNSALMPFYGQASNNPKKLDGIPKLATYYVMMISFIGISIVLLAPEFILIIFPPSYHSAIYIIPWLLLGVYMQGLYFIPMNIITQTKGITKGVSWATFTAGSVNIILNIFLIDQYGIYVAAINTTIGYSLLFIMIFFIANKIHPINFEYKRILRIIILTLLFFAIGQYINSQNIVVTILLNILLIIAYPFTLLFIGFFSNEEIRDIEMLFKGQE